MPGPQVPWDKRRQPQSQKGVDTVFHWGYFPRCFPCVCVRRKILELWTIALFVCSGMFSRAWAEARDDAESISTDMFLRCFPKGVGGI